MELFASLFRHTPEKQIQVFEKPMPYVQMLSLIMLLGQASSNDEAPLTPLNNCVQITDSEIALHCFKTETSNLLARIESGEVVVLDRQAATRQNVAAFGRREENPAISALGAENPDQIETTLVSTTTLADGKLRFTLGDGSHWIQIDSAPIRSNLRAGTTTVVKRAALGSYLMQVGRSRDIRVRRVN